MTNRRQFLTGMAGAAALSLPGAQAEGARRRFLGRGSCARNPPQFIQPNYTAWEAAALEGLAEAEVWRVLGPPLDREETTGPPDYIPLAVLHEPEIIRSSHCYRWSYGHLDFQFPLIPAEYFGFAIYFKKGRVIFWSEPFDRPLSADGRPTIPRLVTPQKDMAFTSDVNFIDFRWTPPSGVYPMQFVLEHVGGYDTDVETENGKWQEKRRWNDPVQFCLDIPHLAFPHGPGYHRWRVKARNSVGEGQWSGWRDFRIAEKD
jgi:hypothetical protein